jgi:putative ABC transport system permease protein
VSRTLLRASLRHLSAHPLETVLALVGIALGVAAVLSIDLANESARRAFERSSERVAGRTTHQIVGGPAGVPEALYRDLRVELGARQAAPVMDRDVGLPDHPGRSLRLLGVDPFAESAVRGALDVESAPPSSAALLTQPGAALIAREAAEDLGVTAGAAITIRVGARRHRVEIVGVLARRSGLEDLLLTDIATAQELVGHPGRIDRIDLVVAHDAAGTELLARVRARLPAGVELVSAGAHAHALGEATRGFRVNLIAMSLLALFVGLFLVYNTMLFAVVQRRTLLGTLRAMGVTRREIFALVLGEAALLGLVATTIGVPLGILIAHGLVSLVTRTINDLYFVLHVRELAIPMWSITKAVMLGTVGSVVAALVPALEATATPPRAVLARIAIEQRARRTVRWLAPGGLALVAVGTALIGLAGNGLAISYAGLFAVFLGLAMFVPLSAVVLMRLAEVPLVAALGPTGRLAARGVTGSLSRTGVAMSALAIAVAATVGVTVMVGSFRDTVARWLTTSLQADLYVSSPSLVGNRPDATLSPELVARLRDVPGVAAVGTSRVTRVDIDGAPVTVVAIDPPRAAMRAFRFADEGADRAWQTFRDGGVFVSEPFAYRRGRSAGDRLRVRSERGVTDVPVAAVVRDYGSSEGLVLMNRATYDRLWDDRAVSSVALYAAPGIPIDQLAHDVRRAVGDTEIVLRKSATIREDSLAIFDRTFAVTGVLRLLVTAVAFVGVLAALMALELERARELAILRAQGLTPGEVWRLVTAQTGLLGLVSGLAAIPTGLVLAWLLVFVINRRAFGWTLDFVVAPSTLVQAVVLALAAALLAGLYPAWRLGRNPLASGLREE